MEADIIVANQPIPDEEEAAINVDTDEQRFTWVPFYREMCTKLSEYSSAQLISTLKQVIEPENQVGLNDQNPKGAIIELADMDPYTFLSFINKLGDAKRVAVLTRLRNVMKLKTSAPTDTDGLPTAQPQQVWLFSYAYKRKPDDIDKLRALYQQVKNDTLTSEQLGRVLEIRNVGKAKLTESLFYQKPERYLPINGQTIPWLKARGLPADFNTFTDYMQLLHAVEQYDPRPSYEISREAYLETTSIAQPTEKEEIDKTGYWVFQGNPNQFRIIDSLKDNALQTWRVAAHSQKIKPGDKIILWVTGKQPGCYALAQVASEVYMGADETGEHYYQKTGPDKEVTQRVKITILHNLWDQPVLKSQLQDLPAFADFNGGNQGTNFIATLEQYELIQHMSQFNSHSFWKYSPGRNANRWPDDLREGLMAIDFSNYNTGSLNQYNTKTDLDNHLGKVDGNSNQTWNMMLFKDASIGDVVFANQGLTKVIGIGIITGPYQYRGDDPHNQHYRTVNWLADQPWQYTKHQFAGQQNLFRPDTFSPTLIGSLIIEEYVKHYPQYRSVFEQHGLLNMPTVSTNHPKNIILYGPPGTGKTYGTIDLAVEIVDGYKQEVHQDNKSKFDQLRTAGQIEFVTFHQNYSYEDFVAGLKPDADAGSLKFEAQVRECSTSWPEKARDQFHAELARTHRVRK